MVILAYLNHKNAMIAKEIAANLYVDNILFKADTVEEALQKYHASKAIFSEIGMNLREYISNSSKVNAAIPENDRLQGRFIKFLGVEYDTENDDFLVKTRIPEKTRLTKRDIVSQLNSVYDPMGFTGSLMIKLKALTREIYGTGLAFKDTIPVEMQRKWNNACQEVNNVTLNIPRPASSIGTADTSTCLWTFCDASKIAVAACTYLQDLSTREVTQLISGKTRLTPKKTVQTIPR
ncbi:hypothetical protein Y032_0180g771 [Ancylostoma ceylanicum]|uniref:Uncharacterized protein n=1 Tax=Ancylostoma ceylanicum TaxID=53326 RepID=A0A016SST7_9BILA|nr:hypothetical protein Y032_0180g771 [Ancylostoma ceylanicum]